MAETGAFGKKILFLYPPPVLSEIVEELARREFEVYLVKDHGKIRRFLPKNPESILFINLDEVLEEREWEGYVKEIKGNAETATVGIGVLSLNDVPELKQKYLMDIQVPCGFITLKIGSAKTTEILIKTLEANEARGKRKFVRAVCPPGSAQFFVETSKGETLRGEVHDFSSAGLALNFEEGKTFQPGTILRGLQLAVKGGRVIADGIIVANRGAAKTDETAEKTQGNVAASHVVMFDPGSLDDAKREKLRSLVFKVNQFNLDRLLESF